jgi:hypothetical protein
MGVDTRGLDDEPSLFTPFPAFPLRGGRRIKRHYSCRRKGEDENGPKNSFPFAGRRRIKR